MSGTSEFDLIARIRARVAHRDDVVLGIGDDAALLRPPDGALLAVTQDSLNRGVHFSEATTAADLGHKALAVNLSDLAAMGARPAWCTLALSLPGADPAWLDGFLDGFLALAGVHGVALVGGDLTRGPLSISVTAIGTLAAGRSLRRDRARDGDGIWVTGCIGDAAAALALSGAATADAIGPDTVAALRARLDRPTPRIDAGLALAGLAHSCIDLSDGLLADLGHLLAASGVGAEIELAALPTSAALEAAFGLERRRELQLEGGDDYELCFTAAADAGEAIDRALRETGTPAVRIGRVLASGGIVLATPDGRRRAVEPAGFDHFRGRAG